MTLKSHPGEMTMNKLTASFSKGLGLCGFEKVENLKYQGYRQALRVIDFKTSSSSFEGKS